MRAKEFIIENETDTIEAGVADAMPATYALSGLKNNDAYQQYRFGLALASARARKEDDATFTDESEYGENMVVVARSAEEEETLAMALALFGHNNEKKLISTKKSEEAKDTYTQSPVVQNSGRRK